MSRRFGLAAATLLLLAPAAQAKAPPAGFRVCGASGCVTVVQADAERLSVWHVGFGGAIAPPAPAPFYTLQFRWQPTAALQTVHWLPSQHAFRSGAGLVVAWQRADDSMLTALVAGIEPYPVPKISGVTVGGRSARGAPTYLRLFSAGRATNVWPGVAGWLRLRFTADGPSPWTDATADVRVSTSGGYLLRDDTVFRIPPRLADRIRRRLPLS